MRVKRVSSNKYDESHGHTIVLIDPDYNRINTVLEEYPTALLIDGNIECWDWKVTLRVASELDPSYT